MIAATALKIENQQKIFFPNLDAFRFISFLLVFWFHVNKVVFVNLKDQPIYSFLDRVFGNGELGVNFFFVLSGFLITYLLLQEKKINGRIHILNFYARRILRIWPLFYLSVFIGFIVFPLIKNFAGLVPSENANPIYYLFFLNNFDYINNWPLFPDALSLIVLWSVAVEEQFYLVWPIALAFLKQRLYPVLFFAVIAGSLIFRSFYISESSHNNAVLYFHTFSVIGDLAVGALIAYYSFSEGRFYKWIRQLGRGSIILLYLIAIIIILFKNEIFHNQYLLLLERLIIATVFGLLILEQNYSKNSFFKLGKWKTVSQLGKYTYGLYCYHFMVISISANVVLKFGTGKDSLFSSILAALISLIVTVIISYFSFKYFERPFLKLKNRFSFIVKE